MQVREFTPEINQSLYERMARPVREQGARDVASARSTSLARGLTGDPFEASLTGLAKQGTANKLSDINADIQWTGAGMARDERLTGEQRAYGTSEREAGQQFQGAQNEANRAFQERLARLGYQNQREQADRESEGGLLQLGGTVLGTYLGGPAGGYAGSRLASYF